MINLPNVLLPKVPVIEDSEFVIMDKQNNSGKVLIFKRIGSGLLSLCFVLLAILLIWQGSAIMADRAAAVETPPSTAVPLVSVDRIVVQSAYSVERRFTGQIEAPQSADLSFEQGGTLARVLVNDGDQVQQGQLLAELDDRSLKAEVVRLKASMRALQSQLELASITDQRQNRLQQNGFTSAQSADQARIAVDEIRARIAETQAAVSIANIRLEKSKVSAPFSGAVNQVLIDAGNAVAGGQTVISMVEQSQPIFRVGIDPRVSNDVALNDELTINISGHQYRAQVLSVLPQIDPATRTRIVRARITDAPALAFGLTGEAVFRQSIIAVGAWVPLVALEDGVRGLWTLNTLSSENPPVVQLEAVEVIHAESHRAYVRGTFIDGATFISDGVHRVVTGQPVRVSY